MTVVTMLDRSVRQVVRDVMDGAEVLDMPVLVAGVLERIPVVDRAVAFEEVLPVFIRMVMNETRRVPVSMAPVVSEGAVREASRLVPQNPSRKRAVIRAEFERMLDAIYPGADGRSKQLREFTAVDLEAVSARCREMAEANAVKSDRFARLSVAVREAGVARLGDLPSSDLSVLLAD